MNRIPQAALTVLVLVGVPGVIGAVTKSPGAAAGPTKASLDVGLHGSGHVFLRVVADGAPPGDSATLADAGGLHAAVVSPKPAKACSQLDKRYATSAPSGREWCLELSNIPIGHKVSGTVQTPGTALALTASRRAPFFWSPFWAAALGLALGMLVIVVPRWLRNRVRTNMLEEIMKRNDDAPDDERIDCLRAWVTRRRAANITDDSLVPVVESVIELGPPAARSVRADLARSLAATGLPATHPFVVAATELSASTVNKVEDFLKEDGTAQTPHPLRAWISALKRLELVQASLTADQQAIDALPAGARADASEALANARAAMAVVDTPAGVDDVVTAEVAVKREIAKARQQQPPEGFLVAGSEQVRLAWLAAGTEDLRGIGRQLKPATSLGWLRLVTVGLVVLVVAWAVLVVEQTVYEPNATFGTASDYLALVTAAIGSGAAATVLSLMAMWDPSSPATDE